MKTLIIALLLTSSVSAQRATLENDTAKYNNVSYYVDKVVNLYYGSANDKTFAFVFVGSGMTGVTKLQSHWSKYPVKIDKVYKTGGKVYFRGVALNESGNNAIPMNKVFVDIAGAVDFKEIEN